MLQKLKSWFAPDPWEASARSLYHEIVAQARLPIFYEKLGVPDTANGRFDMIVLHCFCVMQRLKKEPEGYDLSQMLMTVLVDDLDRNLREMGVGDLSVGKKVKRIAEGFYGRLDAYSSGFTGDLVGDRDVLTEGLKRNLYSSVDQPDEGAVATVAEYLCCEIDRVNGVALADLQAGILEFGEPGRAMEKATENSVETNGASV